MGAASVIGVLGAPAGERLVEPSDRAMGSGRDRERERPRQLGPWLEHGAGGREQTLTVALASRTGSSADRAGDRSRGAEPSHGPEQHSVVAPDGATGLRVGLDELRIGDAVDVEQHDEIAVIEVSDRGVAGGAQRQLVGLTGGQAYHLGARWRGRRLVHRDDQVAVDAGQFADPGGLTREMLASPVLQGCDR